MQLPNEDTVLCGVIGHPIKHSLSPAMHNAGYEALDLNFFYRAYDVTDVAGFLAEMRTVPLFRGLSVTIPHKLAVLEYLDALEPLAEKIGSVNTITHEDGRLTGASTDGPGTLRAFAEAGVSLEGKRVLFTGAGGAVRAVAFAAADQGGASQITLLARTPAKVEELAADLESKTNARIAVGHLDTAGAELAEHEVLIQGTPMGMAPDYEGQSCIPSEALSAGHVVLDMVYRPRETRLIAEARATGCTVITGDSMLLHQGTLQFERWTGQPAPIDSMRGALLEALG